MHQQTMSLSDTSAHHLNTFRIGSQPLTSLGSLSQCLTTMEAGGSHGGIFPNSQSKPPLAQPEAALARSGTATGAAYQHNMGLCVPATGVAKDPNFLHIKASFRQRQFEPNHSSWDSYVLSIGVVFMLTVPEAYKKPPQ